MRIKSLLNKKFVFILLLLNMLYYGKSLAQITGSLFLLPDNFYAQMYNPSYIRNDKATEFSIPVFGGLSFINQGSFKISEIITTTPEGNPVVDFDNFYKHVNPNNFIRQDFSIPMVFVSVAMKKGVFSFFYKENFSSALKFKDEFVEFLINGNLDPGYHNFNSGEINLATIGHREFAFGFAKKQNEKLDVGIRAKLLFGAVYFNAQNWIYGIETSPMGEIVTLSSGGGGQLMVPFRVELTSDNRIYLIESENALQKYFGSYKNPGFAIDAGITYYMNETSIFSASIRDLGGIWNRANSFKINQDESYDFVGFDMVSAVRYPEETGYTNPQFLVKTVKDSVSMVYQPAVDENKNIKSLSPKTVVHYQYASSEKHTFGITNQSTFNKNYFNNILTVSAMQSWPNLKVFESLNLHGVSDISLGGGIQYETNFAQFFLATDNFIAFYHPANNKSFSVTGGICFLLNTKKESNVKSGINSVNKRNGKTSRELPFYKKLNN